MRRAKHHTSPALAFLPHPGRTILQNADRRPDDVPIPGHLASARRSVTLRIDRGGKPERDTHEHHHGQSGPRSPRCPVPTHSRTTFSLQEANPPDSRRAFSQASTSRSSQRKSEPTRIAGGPSPRMRHARKQPTLTVRRSATCLMVRSRGARFRSNVIARQTFSLRLQCG